MATEQCLESPRRAAARTALGLGLSVALAAFLWDAMGALEEPAFMSAPNAVDAARVGEPQAPAAGPMTAELAALRRDLATLREEVGFLRGRVLARESRQPEVEQPTDAEADAVQQGVPEALEEAARAAEQRHAERLEAIESALAGEAVDPVWSEEAGRGIERVFARGIFREARLLGVECRSTLCRVDVLHQGPAALQQFTASFPAEVAAYVTGMTMRQAANADGSITAILYLAREGNDFPS